MAYLAQQIRAWKQSWERLSDASEETRRRFLDRVGRCLGETEAAAAVRRARLVLGIPADGVDTPVAVRG